MAACEQFLADGDSWKQMAASAATGDEDFQGFGHAREIGQPGSEWQSKKAKTARRVVSKS